MNMGTLSLRAFLKRKVRALRSGRTGATSLKFSLEG